MEAGVQLAHILVKPKAESLKLNANKNSWAGRMFFILIIALGIALYALSSKT